MDPNANLQEQERIINGARPSLIEGVRVPQYGRLRELREALYDWIREGGFEPDWSLAPNARKYFGR